MNSLTPKTTENNIEYIQRQIDKKISGPYMANNMTAKRIVTDMDHHPYTRWFRGVYYYHHPVIMEREAGWRPLENSCYNMVIPVEKDKQPSHCYSPACSTIFPCFRNNSSRFSDMEKRDNFINDQCVVQYR